MPRARGRCTYCRGHGRWVDWRVGYRRQPRRFQQGPGWWSDSGVVICPAWCVRRSYRQERSGPRACRQGSGFGRKARRPGHRRGEVDDGRTSAGGSDLVPEHPADSYCVYSVAGSAVTLRTVEDEDRPAPDCLCARVRADHSLHVSSGWVRQHLPE